MPPLFAFHTVRIRCCDFNCLLFALITCKTASFLWLLFFPPTQDLAACLCMDSGFIGLDGAQTISEQPAICFQSSSIRPVNRAGLGRRHNETETESIFLLLWSTLQALLDRGVLPPRFTLTANWLWSPRFINVDCRTVTRRLVSSMLVLFPVLIRGRFTRLCVLVCKVRFGVRVCCPHVCVCDQKRPCLEKWVSPALCITVRRLRPLCFPGSVVLLRSDRLMLDITRSRNCVTQTSYYWDGLINELMSTTLMLGSISPHWWLTFSRKPQEQLEHRTVVGNRKGGREGERADTQIDI